MRHHDTPFSNLVGHTLTEVRQTRDKIVFVCRDGTVYEQYHDDDCCESVEVDDVCGEFADIIGSPILAAEESCPDLPASGSSDESHTWTFYKIDTAKGGVTIKWYGTSNGYYSETVSFYRVAA